MAGVCNVFRDNYVLVRLLLGSHTHQALNTRLDSASYSAFPLSKVDRRLFILLTQFLSFALGTVESRNHDSSSRHPIMFDARLHEDVHR